MQIHLDPVGGVAGDMFAAALLDAWPELQAPLRTALAAAGLEQLVAVERLDHRDHALAGSRFAVRPVGDGQHRHHRAYADIRDLLHNCGLAAAVKARAVAIFGLLAQAEGRVHGIAADEVVFHEVGAWDSIADIVSAAWLIDRLAADWSCAPLPMGSGRVRSAHGKLPLPAPAAALLLEGFPLFQDGLEGERITPTGAAILRHLQPRFDPLTIPLRLQRSGIGFGAQTFPGISNILRVLAFASAAHSEQVVVCQFELDDQSPEDLAVALQRLRESPAVLDVLQSPAFGKKGRMVAQVQILTRPQTVEQVLQRCFSETSTLGVRWQTVQRTVLERQTDERLVTVDDDNQRINQRIRVKRAERPGGVTTVKAEMDDLAQRGGHAARQALRRRAEATDD